MTHGLFGWVDGAVPDLDTALQFYGRLFRWEAREADTGGSGRYALFLRDGKLAAGMGELSAQQIADGEKPVWTSYVLVDDADDIAARAPDLGGTVVAAPFSIPDAGRVTFVADREGALLGYWQPQGMGGADAFNDPGFLCWNELRSRDMEAALAFYGGLLPWEFEKEVADGFEYTTARLGERENAGMFDITGLRPDAVPPHWAVYLSVDDMDTALSDVAAGGGSVIGEVRQSAFGPIVDVVDPFGAAFRIIDMSDE